ncbi:hypothetical protein K501DRAFT_267510 [Backusella circina FSU 941]|nr:hypothetical protein K501DRAFT_267510 [Backusella circina FSU 941]
MGSISTATIIKPDDETTCKTRRRNHMVRERDHIRTSQGTGKSISLVVVMVTLSILGSTSTAMIIKPDDENTCCGNGNIIYNGFNINRYDSKTRRRNHMVRERDHIRTSQGTVKQGDETTCGDGISIYYEFNVNRYDNKTRRRNHMVRERDHIRTSQGTGKIKPDDETTCCGNGNIIYNGFNINRYDSKTRRRNHMVRERNHIRTSQGTVVEMVVLSIMGLISTAMIVKPDDETTCCGNGNIIYNGFNINRYDSKTRRRNHMMHSVLTETRSHFEYLTTNVDLIEVYEKRKVLTSSKWTIDEKLLKYSVVSESIIYGEAYFYLGVMNEKGQEMLYFGASKFTTHDQVYYGQVQ